MEGKASEKLEELGKLYLEHLINNYENKPILLNKDSQHKEKENKLKINYLKIILI